MYLPVARTEHPNWSASNGSPTNAMEITNIVIHSRKPENPEFKEEMLDERITHRCYYRKFKQESCARWRNEK